ncbi:MAG: hypothetical protein ACKOXO_04980 [Cyanobium sp.]
MSLVGQREQLWALCGTLEGSNRPPQTPVHPRRRCGHPGNDYLSRDDWHDVALLLRDGPTSWERSYPPLPEMTNLVAELVVRCDGDRVEGC